MCYTCWNYIYPLYDLPFYSQRIKTINFNVVNLPFPLWVLLLCLINFSIYKYHEDIIHYLLKDCFELPVWFYKLLRIICIGIFLQKNVYPVDPASCTEKTAKSHYFMAFMIIKRPNIHGSVSGLYSIMLVYLWTNTSLSKLLIFIKLYIL